MFLTLKIYVYSTVRINMSTTKNEYFGCDNAVMYPKRRKKIITLNEHTSMTQSSIAMECDVSLGAVNKLLSRRKRRDLLK